MPKNLDFLHLQHILYTEGWYWCWEPSHIIFVDRWSEGQVCSHRSPVRRKHEALRGCGSQTDGRRDRCVLIVFLRGENVALRGCSSQTDGRRDRCVLTVLCGCGSQTDGRRDRCVLTILL